jgi:hypothetical protein
MQYLYHSVPENMSGTVLYPLNGLKETLPEIYSEEIKKYTGRENLLKRIVPSLKCLWNDVLHLTAVSPEDLKSALENAGFKPKTASWFKIPISLVAGNNSTVFTYGKNRAPEEPDLFIYETFDSERMPFYGTIPEETLEYYRQEKAEGNTPLSFEFVPHILYKGSIETTGLEIVTL